MFYSLKPSSALKTNVKTSVVLSGTLLIGLACTSVVVADKAKFYSSGSSSAFKSRASDIRSEAGQSSLNRAKSMSGVGGALFPSGSSSIDRATSKKLLKFFDQKKNWMFQELGEDDEIGGEGEEWLQENGLLGNEESRHRNPFSKTRGVVGNFLYVDEKEESRSRKKSRQRRQPEALSGEKEERELREAEFAMDPDQLKSEGNKKKTSLFLAGSPFKAKTALADFSPFSREGAKSADPFKARGNTPGRRGVRVEAGRVGVESRLGFFQQQNKNGVKDFSKSDFFNSKPGGSGKGALGLDPMSFGRGLTPKPSTPVTGVGETSAGFKLPPGLVTPSLVGNPLSSSLSAPSAAARRESPLLFQSRARQHPVTRSGLLNQKPGIDGRKPGRGF